MFTCQGESWYYDQLYDSDDVIAFFGALSVQEYEHVHPRFDQVGSNGLEVYLAEPNCNEDREHWLEELDLLAFEQGKNAFFFCGGGEEQPQKSRTFF